MENTNQQVENQQVDNSVIIEMEEKTREYHAAIIQHAVDKGYNFDVAFNGLGRALIGVIFDYQFATAGTATDESVAGAIDTFAASMQEYAKVVMVEVKKSMEEAAKKAEQEEADTQAEQE